MRTRILKRLSKPWRQLVLGMALASGSAFAAQNTLPFTLAEQPLFLGRRADPNILYLVDDSGSMDMGLVTTLSDSALPHFGNTGFTAGAIPRAEDTTGTISAPGTTVWLLYGHVFQTSDTNVSPTANNQGASFSAFIPAPIDEMFINDAANPNYRTPPAGCPNPTNPGLWRVSNKDFNSLYYDPAVRYKKWLGRNSTGTADYADASPTAALLDASTPGDGTYNLTALQLHTTQYVYPGCSGSPSNIRKILDQPFAFSPSDIPGTVSATEKRRGQLSIYPARYHSWTADAVDSDGDGSPVDPADAHQYIEIRAAGDTACSFNASCPASFAKGAARDDCVATPGLCTRTEELNNFANWFQYYRRRLLTAKAAFGGVTFEQGDTVRMGLVTMNSNPSPGVHRAIRNMNLDYTVSDKKSLLDSIYGMAASNVTPSQTALNNASKYLECPDGTAANSDHPYTGSSFTSHPTSGATGTRTATCPHLSLANGGECQRDFLIFMTDGFYNQTSSRPTINNTDGPAKTFTNGDPPNPWDGGAMADGRSDTLGDIAMKFYETDTQPGLNNLLAEIPDVDKAPHQHVVTYGVAFGVQGDADDSYPGINPATDMPADRFAAFTWPDPAQNSDSIVPGKIDDLMHAAFNGRGKFLSARQPQALITALEDAITSISEHESSASSVALNSGSLNTGTAIFQARFNSGDWTGELLAFPISAGPGLTAGCTSQAIGQVCPQAWNAGTVLAGQAHGSRNIITMKTTAKNGTIAGNSMPFLYANLDADEKAFLNFNVDTGVTDPGPAANITALGTARVDYLRGDKTNEAPFFLDLRPRSTPLGDIVNSDPFFVGPPRAPFDGLTGYTTFRNTNQNRIGMVYVGANDGKLHGFCVKPETGCPAGGHEKFAFIPGERGIYEDLSGLVSQGYNTRHRYFLDGSPSVSDAEVGGVGSWKTVLVSGMRGGGQGLFALDVTDPTNFGTDKVLWQFTDVDDPDLGYTFARPAIAKMRNGKWAAIVGNGYNSTKTTFGSRNLTDPNVSTTGKAYLYIIFLNGPGDNIWNSPAEYVKIEVNAGSVAVPNGLSSATPVDVRQVTGEDPFVTDFIYAGDLLGNLWKFDVSSTAPTDWGVAFSGQPLYRACTANDCTKAQPITSRPEVGLHPDGDPGTHGVLVYFGTGRYVATTDSSPVSEPTQSFYMVWDAPGVSAPIAFNKLVEQTIDGEQLFPSGACDDNTKAGCFRITSPNAVDISNPGSPAKLGCFMNLDVPGDANTNRGERIVSDPVLREDRIVFTTLIPSENTCEFGGTGFLMELSPTCGRLGSAPFDVTGPDGVPDGVIDELDLIAGVYPGGIGSSQGILPRPTVLAVTPEAREMGGGTGSGCIEYKYMSGSQGGVMRVEESCGYRTGRINWRQIR